jgi:hypothetical protein
MDEYAEARARIERAAATLEETRRELEAVRESIPPSPQELSAEDLPLWPDVPTELRGVLATVVPDYLDSVIRSLFAAAHYRPAPGAAKTSVDPAEESARGEELAAGQLQEGEVRR